MPKTNILRNSFNSGEISGLISERSDQAKYFSGCLTLQNAIPLVEGGAKKMPGTYFVKATKYANRKARLIPFSFSTNQTYQLEFGNEYIRIFTDDGILTGGLSGVSEYVPGTSYAAAATIKIGSYISVRWTGGAILSIAAPFGQYNANTVRVEVSVNSGDTLSVSKTGASPSQGIRIKLANATPANNSVAAIQTAIRALVSLNSTANNFVDLADWYVEGNSTYRASPPIIAATSTAGVPSEIILTTPGAFANAGSAYAMNGGSGTGLVIRVDSVTGYGVPGSVSILSPGSGYLEGDICTSSGDWAAGVITISAVLSSAALLSSIMTGYTAVNPSQYEFPPEFPTDWSVGVVSSEIVEITTPYQEADLFDLDVDTQSADVLYILHRAYPPAKLMRYSNVGWTLQNLACRGTSDIAKTNYQGIGKVITGITQASPAGVTCLAHGYATGDRVYINNVAGMVEVNQGEFIIHVIDGNSFSLYDPDTGAAINSTSFIAYISGGWAVKVISMFAAAGDLPACGTLYEQRLFVGGSDNHPLRFNGSVQGDFENFISDTHADDYAIQFDLLSKKIDRIRWMTGFEYLIMGTASGPWFVTGATEDQAITQTSINAKKQISTGVGNVAPQMVNDSVIWVTRSAKTVRLLLYQWQSNKWTAPDLTRIARHITLGDDAATSGIVQTSFQAEPYPLFWAARADGQLPGMTYESQEQVYAWYRIVTDGLIESVSSNSRDNNEDEVWIIANRTINGQVVRYVEYFKPHEIFNQLSNAFYVHCGLQWDGGAAVNITHITQADPPEVTAPAHGRTTGQSVRIKDVVGMTELNCDPAQAYTVTVLDDDHLTLDGMDSSAFTPYVSSGTVQRVTNTVEGLTYLLGKDVWVVGDGAKMFDVPQTVTGDTLAFEWYANLVTVGLPYTMIVQPTNPVLGNQQGTSKGELQKVNEISLSVYQSVGGKYGSSLNDADLYKIPYTTGMTGNQPTLATEEDIPVDFPGDWGRKSEIYIVNDEPYPFTLRSFNAKITVNPS